MVVRLLYILLLLPFAGLAQARDEDGVYVLGVAQDGGYPHAGCTKKCCEQAWNNAGKRRYVTSLAVVSGGKWWLFEATPDIKEQLQYFRQLTGGAYSYLPEGIFITHAHIGHYTGLMQLGREAMNTSKVPVYVLPRLKSYLEKNGPWSQLVELKNIELRMMEASLHPAQMRREDMGKVVSDGLGVTAFTVPHRDEYSETAGFRIALGEKRYLFIPDIDKWEKWMTDIRILASRCDVALVDGTFFEAGEIPGRNMSEIPHPFVRETAALFQGGERVPGMPDLRSVIYFIHFNHTNPLLWDDGRAKELERDGFHIARQGDKL